MNYASLTNLPASTKFPVDSVDGGRVISATVGSGRLVAFAATEFLAIAVAANSSRFHRAALFPISDAAPAPLLQEGVL
jgi:hypothetical protein